VTEGRRRTSEAGVVEARRLGGSALGRDGRRNVAPAREEPRTWQARMRSSSIAGMFDPSRSRNACSTRLDRLGLSERIRLSTPRFMVLPAIVGATDLGVVCPCASPQSSPEVAAFASRSRAGRWATSPSP
jgi:hypothetical protein